MDITVEYTFPDGDKKRITGPREQVLQYCRVVWGFDPSDEDRNYYSESQQKFIPLKDLPTLRLIRTFWKCYAEYMRVARLEETVESVECFLADPMPRYLERMRQELLTRKVAGEPGLFS